MPCINLSLLKKESDCLGENGILLPNKYFYVLALLMFFPRFFIYPHTWSQCPCDITDCSIKWF